MNNMFSFGRRGEEQPASPEKSSGNHRSWTNNTSPTSNGIIINNSNTVTSSFSPSPSSQATSPRQQQQQPKRGSGGNGFSPINMSRKKLLGGRRFGGDVGGGGGGGINKKSLSGGPKNHMNKDLQLNVDETTNGIEVSFHGSHSLHSSPSNGAAAGATPLGGGGRNARGGSNPHFQTTQRFPKAPPQGQQEDEFREPAPPTTVREPVISLKEQLRQRQRVWRSQFSVAFPALQKDETGMFVNGGDGPASSSSVMGAGPPQLAAALGTNTAASTNGPSFWRPKGHRIPLVGITPADAAFADTLHLLQSSRVADERSAVHVELKQLDAEISALEKDRKHLERHMTQKQQKEKERKQNGSVLVAAMNSFSFLQASKSNESGGSGASANEGGLSTVDWDGHKILQEDALKRHLLLTPAERTLLQRQRGNSLTIRLDNPRTKEMFVHRCGGKLHQVQRSRLFKGVDSIVTLHPGNCRSSPTSSSGANGAASDLQQVELIAATGSYNGFFFARDGGKSQTWGRIPNKLYRRMEQEGAGSAGGGGGAEIGDLTYLSTGPHGSYYAEFQSGECWWGSAVEDADFQNLMRSWDVYRVSFGPIESFAEDDRGNKTVTTSSWIILSRDGRAAWKNLPSRLTHKLEGRLASWAAPAEVSLGPGDSYFVRFLDGTVDYCLPADIARVCEQIEKRGGRITSICLHPDISNDFVIRHTDMTR